MSAVRVTCLNTPETNGVLERLHQTLRCEHSYQCEIELAAALAEEVDDSPRALSEVRPQEALGQRIDPSPSSTPVSGAGCPGSLTQYTLNSTGETRYRRARRASRIAHGKEVDVRVLPSREDRSRSAVFGLIGRSRVLRSRRRAQVLRRLRLPAAAQCGRIAALLVVCLLLAGSAIATPVSTAAIGRPVARAVLFYSPACQHCRDLIRGYLPSLMDEYGSRLQILSVNAADPAGRKLFQAAVTKFDVPLRDRGVPAVVIGDHFLSGNVDVSEQLPMLVAQYLSEGGVVWPAVPGLSRAMTAAGAVVTSSPSRLLAATEQHDSILDRLARDRWGNTLALIVLAGMLAVVGAVIWRAGRIWRSSAVVRRPSDGWKVYAVLALTALGLCISGYLVYVETTHSLALCGPVGDCNAVQQSTYARLFGVVPIAYVGMVGYLLIGVAFGISRLASRAPARAAARAFFLLTLCGTLFSIYLTALEPFAIGATCAWCLSSAVIVTLLLLLSTNGVRLNRQRNAAAD